MKFALSAILASVLFQDVQSSTLRAEAETEAEADMAIPFNIESMKAHTQKYLETPLMIGSRHTNFMDRTLAISTCPAYLKIAKKTPVFVWCVTSTDAVAPISCAFVVCDGCAPVAYLSGTKTSCPLATSMTGSLIYAPDNPTSNSVYIVSQVSGITASGASADFPISSTYTSPYGNNACGANAFKYIHVNVTTADASGFIGFGIFN